MSIKDLKRKARELLKGKWGISLISVFLYTIILKIFPLIIAELPSNMFTKILSIISSVILFIFTPVLARGLTEVFYRIEKKEKVKIFDFVKYGLRSFKKFWKMTGLVIYKLSGYIVITAILFGILLFFDGTKMLEYGLEFLENGTVSATITEESYVLVTTVVITVLILLMYVLMVVKNMKYIFTTFIALDNHNYSTKEIFNKSEEMMKGNRGKYFVLILSFLGWYLLFALITGAIITVLNKYNLTLLSSFISGLEFVAITPYVKMSTMAMYEKMKNNKKIIKEKKSEQPAE